MHGLLARGADLIGAAQFQGRLFRVAAYPGAVASRRAGDVVRGEVYRLRDPGLLPALDRYEGCDPDHPAAPYVRRMASVTPEAGAATARAWIYLYTGPTDGLERIATGDFLPAPSVGTS
jgi:gamma-glutamylcyclotransferase (GGCT)/AIG2-like uncharacterized protein YtfP